MPLQTKQNPVRWISRLLLIQSVRDALNNYRLIGSFDSTADFGTVGFAYAYTSHLRPGARPWSRSRTAASLLTGQSNGAASGAMEFFLSRSQQQVEGLSGVRVDTIKVDALGDTSDPKPSPTKPADVNPMEHAFDKVVNSRFACTRFQRYQEPPATNDATSTTPTQASAVTRRTASLSNPLIIQSAYHCLALSQRAPTGFNAQPFRIVLVHSSEQKMALSQYCIGRNADRIRDSDCTAVFLSDTECGRDWTRFKEFLVSHMDDGHGSSEGVPDAVTTKNTRARSSSRARRPLSTKALNKMRLLILLFSSGYPFPQILSRPFSVFLRLGVATLAFFSRWLHSLQQKLSRDPSTISNFILKLFPRNSLILPTLSSTETWSQKNTMLVAMTYMLACTSRGLSTCPMEGFDAQGIRSVLGIPRRFGIPLIVSAGTPYRGDDKGVDDVGVSHGDGEMSPRYPMEEIVFGDVFGSPLVCPG